MRFLFLLLVSFSLSFSNDELININFKDLSIMELIKITSEKTNKNILVTNNIKGKVDFISNGPINKENLLDILRFSLEDNGYRIISSNGILRIVKGNSQNTISPKIEKRNSKNKKIKSKASSSSSQVLPENITEVVFLTNIESKSLQKILNMIISQRDYSRSKKPSIAIDELSNSIILDGKKDEVLNLKNIITKLDIIKSQVFVKANIVEIDDNLLENIGLKFGILGGKVHSGGLSTFSSSLNGGNAISIDTGSIGLQIPNVLSSLALGASLNLLNKTYALDVISQPSILCLNNKESSIYVGETVSIQTASTTTDGGTTKNSFKREDIGLTLKVKPRITTNNKVVLEISTILEGIKNTNTSSLNPDTSKKEVITTAIVNNGESVILGGLIENKNEKTIEKIPYASDVPLIGELFKNRIYDYRNKNLVVIVTPYIIPKDKDLTYVRNELSKLKNLEDKFLEEVLINLRAKKEVKNNLEAENKNLNNRQKHEARLKHYFGI
ncbi:MAG: general secretion pathway protein GspD [Arcobacter sp.]|nr:MAG: general secretion pathway protein GspD [Arcobacter sp.]